MVALWCGYCYQYHYGNGYNCQNVGVVIGIVANIIVQLIVCAFVVMSANPTAISVSTSIINVVMFTLVN